MWMRRIGQSSVRAACGTSPEDEAGAPLRRAVCSKGRGCTSWMGVTPRLSQPSLDGGAERRDDTPAAAVDELLEQLLRGDAE